MALVDLAWARLAVRHRPDMFAIVPQFSPDGRVCLDASAGNVQEVIAELAADPAIVGVRILVRLPSQHTGIAVFNRLIAACVEHRLPVFMSTAGDVEAPRTLAQRHPELTVIVDHLAVPQPPSHERGSPPLRFVPRVLELSEQPNVAIKPVTPGI